MMTHKQIQQMFSEESDDEFWGFESILLILCILYERSTPAGFIGPKNYTRVYTVILHSAKSI